jgi:hypothetical protein
MACAIGGTLQVQAFASGVETSAKALTNVKSEKARIRVACPPVKA